MTTRLETRKSVGADTLRFLKETLPRDLSMRPVAKALREGDFDVAQTELKQAVGSYVAELKNRFTGDPAKVAARLVGVPISYILGIGSNLAGTVTQTAVFYDPRGSNPELFSAEPGTIGLHVNTTGRPYSAMLIAAHTPNETGVISIEEVVVGDERWKKTKVTEEFAVEGEQGNSLYRRDSRILLAPGTEPLNIEGFTIQEEEKNGGIYFTLRKE